MGIILNVMSGHCCFFFCWGNGNQLRRKKKKKEGDMTHLGSQLAALSCFSSAGSFHEQWLIFSKARFLGTSPFSKPSF